MATESFKQIDWLGPPGSSKQVARRCAASTTGAGRRSAKQRAQREATSSKQMQYQPIWLQSVAHTMHLSAARSRQAQAAARDKAGWLEWNVKLDLLCIPCLRLRTLQGYGLPHCASSAR